MSFYIYWYTATEACSDLITSFFFFFQDSFELRPSSLVYDETYRIYIDGFYVNDELAILMFFFFAVQCTERPWRAI